MFISQADESGVYRAKSSFLAGQDQGQAFQHIRPARWGSDAVVSPPALATS